MAEQPTGSQASEHVAPRRDLVARRFGQPWIRWPHNALVRIAAHPARLAMNIASWVLWSRSHDHPRHRVVAFDLSHNRFGRHLYLLAEFFTLSGFEVVFRYRMRFLAQLGQYSDRILMSPNMQLRAGLPANAELRITDRQRDGWITLSEDYFRPPHPSALHVPMAMHPNMYWRGYFRMCDDLSSNTNRRIRVLFAGNADRTEYSRGAMARSFGKLDRPGVLNTLESAFHPRILRDGSNRSMALAEPPMIIVCEAATCYIPQSTFLTTLSDSAFFIAAPGVAVPMCHNAVEAMSVGSVPILNYADHFHPPLEHGVNCLTFATADELVRCVAEALAMSEEKIARLRHGVVAYYDRFLRPEAVVHSIVRGIGRVNELLLNSEERSLALLRRRLAQGAPPC